MSRRLPRRQLLLLLLKNREKLQEMMFLLGAMPGAKIIGSRPNLPLRSRPSQTVQAPADIKLSGIAWQEERSSRRAVINGFLLKEGAVVSGAKISEILADRVRFSSAAGTFEIRLDAVLPAEVKR